MAVLGENHRTHHLSGFEGVSLGHIDRGTHQHLDKVWHLVTIGIDSAVRRIGWIQTKSHLEAITQGITIGVRTRWIETGLKLLLQGQRVTIVIVVWRVESGIEVVTLVGIENTVLIHILGGKELPIHGEAELLFPSAVVHHLQVDGFTLTPVLVGAGIGHTVAVDQQSIVARVSTVASPGIETIGRDSPDLQPHFDIG